MSDFAYTPLTALDRSFLSAESDVAPMHIAATQIFQAAPLKGKNGGLDIERIRAYVESRLHRIPRYRQRLAWTPLEGKPIWVDDDRFNLHYHVRHTRLPRPGSERVLKRVAGRILSQQLDRGKPLWEMWVIEGLENDRFAIITKTHHCMIDGLSGVDLLAVLLTEHPTSEIEPPPVWRPRPAPGTLDLVRESVWRRGAGVLGTAQNLWDLAWDQNGARDAFGERLGATMRMLGGGASRASSTPLNEPIGPHRRVDWLPMDLGAVRVVSKHLGASVNDVVLAVVSGAVRRFLERHRHVRVDGLEFRVMTPVSMRSADQRGTLGNQVSAWVVPLPLDERDPRRTVERIRETTEELKRSRSALGAEVLTRVSEWTGPTLLSLGTRLMSWARPFNLVVTNVPGPRVRLYLLGAPMLEAHPMVPLLGNLSLGIALFSYGSRLSWGLSADWDRVPDLHEFVNALRDSFHELCATVEDDVVRAGARRVPPRSERRSDAG